MLAIEALNGSEPVSIPLAAGMLHTVFFRVATGGSPADEVKQFACIVWECFHILRENYPSRVDLADEGLEKCAPYFTDLSKSELMRREVSCIASRRDDPALLTSEELAEVWFVLYTSIKLHEARASLICLQLLGDAGHCPANLFKGVRQSDINLLETLCDESDSPHFSAANPLIADQCRELARDVLATCVKVQDSKEMGTFSEGELSMRLSVPPGAYDTPSSVRAMIFQLNETVCVERATFLLECINNKAEEEGLQGSHWMETMQAVLHKYCEGVYGSEDHDVIKYGLFQHQLTLCLSSLSRSPETFLSMLTMGLLIRLFEVVEEACLLAYRMIMDKAEETENRLFEFLGVALSLGELSVSAAFYKFLRPILDGLYKVDSRLLSFIETGEEDKDIPAPADPEELRVLSPDLFSIRERVKSMIMKLEALTEYQESFEEKYQRLFRKRIPPSQSS